MIPVIVGVVALAAGVVVGFLIRANIAKSSANTLEAQARQKSIEADEKLVKADQEAAAVLRRANEDAKSEAAQVRRDAEDDVKSRRDEIARLERRISESEEDLRERTRKLDQRGAELDERDGILHDARMQLEKAADQHRTQLERVAGMTSSEAREELVAHVVDDAKRSAMAQVREIEQQAREDGEERARKIVTIAIQRVASEQTAESTVSVFALPSEDMKGRIIGREGRNIRAFEATTGVNLIIDDTPEAVVLCCFDPVRRESARMTLEKLVAGRPDPPRADRGDPRAVDGRDRGADPPSGRGRRRRGRHHRRPPRDDPAARAAPVPDVVRPERAAAPGRERAHIASAIAAELGVDPDDREARRVPARHREGRDPRGRGLARDHRRRDRAPLKEDPEVVHCIESHHGEVEQRTIDAVLAQIADSISGGRPGARRESLETYVKRLERLEEICNAFAGVEKIYRDAGRPRGPRHGQAGGRRRHPGAGDRARHRQAGGGGAAVPRADQDHGRAGDARGRVRASDGG